VLLTDYFIKFIVIVILTFLFILAGVFFDDRVEHIKFVDFCGKYRIPLLQYLCSSKCIVNHRNILGDSTDSNMMRKVLLG